MKMKKKTLTARELERYQKMLLDKQQMLAQHIQSMEKLVLESPLRDATGELTNLPTHIADLSADTFNQNLTIELLAGEEEVMKDISDALQRIEEGTFGICEECSEEILPKRLDYIPYARLCVRCKSEEEKRNRNRWNSTVQ